MSPSDVNHFNVTTTREITYRSQPASGNLSMSLPASTGPAGPSSPTLALSTAGGSVYTPSHSGFILAALKVRKIMVKEDTLNLDLEKGVGVLEGEKNKGLPAEETGHLEVRGSEWVWCAWGVVGFPPDEGAGCRGVWGGWTWRGR